MAMRQLFEKLESILDKIDIDEARKHKMIEFMELCPVICFIKDGETGRYIFVNDIFRTIIDVDIIGKKDIDIFPMDDALRFVTHDLQVLKSEHPIQTIEKLKDKLFFVVKFIIINGGRYIGGMALEIPDTVVIKTKQQER